MRIKAIVIAVVAIVLATLGGAAVYMRAAPSHAPDAAEEGATAPEGKSPVPVTVPVPVNTLLVPVVRHGRLDGHLALSLILEAVNEEAARRVRGHMPSLRDAFLREVSDMPVQIEREGEAVDVEALRRRLAERAVAVLGADALGGVLIAGAMPFRP